jgi:DNA polymerase V
MPKFDVSQHIQISQIFAFSTSTQCELPLYLSPVPAGFPSPADDYLEDKLDLNQYLVQKPAATFYLKVIGDSMNGAGILSGDVLVVDRSIDPQLFNGQIVVAAINGELTVKRLKVRQKRTYLIAENECYQPIEITEAMDVEVWGMVIGVVRKLCRKS